MSDNIIKPTKFCEVCEGTGRIEREPDSVETTPCTDCGKQEKKPADTERQIEDAAKAICNADGQDWPTLEETYGRAEIQKYKRFAKAALHQPTAREWTEDEIVKIIVAELMPRKDQMHWVTAKCLAKALAAKNIIRLKDGGGE